MAMKTTCKDCAFISEFVEPDGSIRLRYCRLNNRQIRKKDKICRRFFWKDE